ncbi:hypothetical protein KY342_00960 [Candidatus Woesearchaeota archaeon]|nr:hypothetical protein [Candidatus Woesearchaeota archaeon]
MASAKFDLEKKEMNKDLVFDIRKAVEAEIEFDVCRIVTALNRINFVYTTMSCSGTPRDHKGNYRGLEKGNYGVEKGGYQGWVLLKADTDHKRFPKFKRNLEKICNVELNEISESHLRSLHRTNKKPIKDLVLQVFVPSEIAKAKDPVYLPNKWNEVYAVLEYYLPSKDPIKDKLKNST